MTDGRSVPRPPVLKQASVPASGACRSSTGQVTIAGLAEPQPRAKAPTLPKASRSRLPTPAALPTAGGGAMRAYAAARNLWRSPLISHESMSSRSGPGFIRMETCRNGISAVRLASTGHVTGRRCPLRLSAAIAFAAARVASAIAIDRIDGTLLSGVWGCPSSWSVVRCLKIFFKKKTVFKD